jgi:hypothetical protein
MLHESPSELAARVERNRIWMDTFGGDRGMAALINANEEEKEEAKVSEIVVEQEETKNINDEEYPKSPKWDDQDPDDVQQEPPPDAMFCGFCLITPCLMIQWQEDIERTDAALYDPGENNRVRRFRFYRNMTRELYGHLGKGVRKPLPPCFVQGARDLYPNDEAEGTYTGFKRTREGNGDGSSAV